MVLSEVGAIMMKMLLLMTWMKRHRASITRCASLEGHPVWAMLALQQYVEAGGRAAVAEQRELATSAVESGPVLWAADGLQLAAIQRS